MNTKIATLPGKVAASAVRRSRANSFTLDHQSEICRDAGLRPMSRPAVLLMVWRTNPASGRLECRWLAEGGGATDEGVSCYDLLRQAA